MATTIPPEKTEAAEAEAVAAEAVATAPKVAESAAQDTEVTLQAVMQQNQALVAGLAQIAAQLQQDRDEPAGRKKRDRNQEQQGADGKQPLLDLSYQGVFDTLQVVAELTGGHQSRAGQMVWKMNRYNMLIGRVTGGRVSLRGVMDAAAQDYNQNGVKGWVNAITKQLGLSSGEENALAQQAEQEFGQGNVTPFREFLTNITQVLTNSMQYAKINLAPFAESALGKMNDGLGSVNERLGAATEHSRTKQLTR